MRRIVATGVGLAVLGGSPAVARADEDAEERAEAAFTTWAARAGLVVQRVACDVEPGIDGVVCYALDAAGAPLVATMNGDGTFTVLPSMATVPANTPATTVAGSAAGVGTADAPVPLGASADIGEGWSLAVGAVDFDAWPEVQAENTFNLPPPTGSVYVMAHVTVGYAGPQERSFMFWTVSAVTSTGLTFASYETLAVAPDAFDSLAQVPKGGTESGNVVFTVPSGATGGLMLAASGSLMGPLVHFATA